MIKLLMFDLWGTIMENGVYSPVKQVRNILRLNMPFSEYIVRFEKVFMLKEYKDLNESFTNVCKEFNIRYNSYLINKLVGVWNKNWLLAKPFPESKEVIDQLRKDYKVVLLSNTDKSALHIIEKFSLDKKFDKIYLSYQTGFLKVNPKLFEEVLKEFNVKPEEAVMIGDSIDSDMKTPSGLGIKTILVDRRGRREYKSKIKNLNEINEIISEWDKENK